MDAKLTLKLNKHIIDGAKEYASAHKKSLSRMVEAYLQSLIHTENTESNNTIEISPFVKSLKSGIKLPSDYDYKKEYRNYVMEKYT